MRSQNLSDAGGLTDYFSRGHMNIEYVRPFSMAWGRMIQALFRPFDLHKWLVLGFTAFLSQLMDGHGGGGGGGDGDRRWKSFADILDYPHMAWEWLLVHPGWFTLIIIGLFVLIALVILLTWLSSRGKFMFLENVVHNRDRVRQPWHEFRALGNSLFVWRLCFVLIVTAVFVGLVILCYFTLTDLQAHGFPVRMSVLAIGGIAMAGLALILTIAYISLFLDDFVVPIMYKNSMTVTSAWGHYLALFSSHWPCFLWYGIVVLLIYIVLVIAVVLTGLLTCCIGFIFLAIPYVGSVITLPISYTLRAFGPEFLAQFGPEFSVFPEEAKEAP